MNASSPQGTGRSWFQALSESRLFRFLLWGAFNTGATLMLYWLLMLVIHYQLAYAASYMLGIALSYVLNARLVFRVPYSYRSAALFPLAYFAAYLAGAAVLAITVEILGVPKWFAPVLSICAVVPLTFALTRLILLPSSER